MSRCEPSSSRYPRASPPSNGSPSTLPTKSSTTKSPLPASRSTFSSDASASRCASSSRVDLLVGRLGLAAARLDSLVVAELAFGRTPTSIVNDERVALLRQVRQVELRVADGRDAGVRDGLLVPRRKCAAERLVEHGLAPELAQHDLRRHLALAEAGHLHLARELLGGGVELLLDGGGLDLDVDAHARPVELGRGCLHGHGAKHLTRVALHRTARPPVRHDAADIVELWTTVGTCASFVDR